MNKRYSNDVCQDFKLQNFNNMRSTSKHYKQYEVYQNYRKKTLRDAQNKNYRLKNLQITPRIQGGYWTINIKFMLHRRSQFILSLKGNKICTQTSTFNSPHNCSDTFGTL